MRIDFNSQSLDSHLAFYKIRILVILGLFFMTVNVDAALVAFQVRGIAGALRSNVQAYLSKYTLNCNDPSWKINTMKPRIKETVTQALQALGYFEPRITNRIQHEPHCWQWIITIQPGPAVRIQHFKFTISGPGKNDPAFLSLQKKTTLKTGMILNQGRYTTLKNALLEAARRTGYFDAHFTKHIIKVNPSHQRATITLLFVTGPQYRFGPISVTSPQFKKSLILGLLDFHRDMPYSAHRVALSQNSLVNSGYFNTVFIQPLVSQRAAGSVPIKVTVTPAKPYQLQLGAGYSTDLGPTLKLDWLDRRINPAGHRFQFSSQISPIDSSASAQYLIPLAHARTDWITLTSAYKYTNTVTAQTHTWLLGASYNHLLGNQWMRTLSLSYQKERSLTAGTALVSRLVIGGLDLNRIVANRPLYPTRGWSADLNLQGAVKGLISDTSFTRATLRIKTITPWAWGQINTRVNLGAIATSHPSLLPATLLFFAGGENSIRGYTYQSIGPTTDNGTVIGGLYQAIASVEYDHHLIGPAYGGVFYDIGDAFNQWPWHPYRGVGIGLRWHTPIGPIKFDIGIPLDGSDRRPHLYLSFGTWLS